MSVNEKMTAIADNIRAKTGGTEPLTLDGMAESIPDVYSAGQSSMIDESKLIPKTVSGSYISVDDVSEIPHDVACKVESVNLLNPDNLSGGEFVEYNGVQCYKYKDLGEHNSESLRIVGDFKENTQYTLTIKQYRNETDSSKYWRMWVRYTDGSEDISSTGSSGQTLTIVTKSEKTVSFIYPAYSYGTTVYLDLSVSCLHKGTTALPYTPYVKPEEVKVTRTGKNLATAQQVWAGEESYAEKVEDGRNTIRFTTSMDVKNELPIFEENTQYTFSFDVKAVLRQATYEGKTDLILRVLYTDGTNTSIYFNPSQHEESVWEKRTLVTTAGKTVQSVGSASYGYYHWICIDIDTFQVEKGATATAYEPYNGQTLTPSADGTVEGMTSVSPYMNIFSDTEGVNIEATYNKSWGMDRANQEWWDNWQQNGQRKTYSYGLWQCKKIPRGRPRFDIINPKTVASLFRNISENFDLEKVLNSWNIIFDTSKTPYFSDFVQGSNVTNIGEIDCSSATHTDYMFHNAALLTTIKKLKLPSVALANSTQMFYGTTSLQNIEIEGNWFASIDFRYSPLTKASITSNINALSSTVTGQTLTLKLSAVNTAFETSSGAGDGSTSAEFAALVATKTNWTITMI